MPNHIDLSPLLADPAAAEILLLARGQLNRAFRMHGLVPPDPLLPSDTSSVDPTELDDPAAQGIDYAMARFQEDFITWASAMPLTLVRPVLDILQQTRQALSQQEHDSNGAAAAVGHACEFLSEHLQPDREVPDST